MARTLSLPLTLGLMMACAPSTPPPCDPRLIKEASTQTGGLPLEGKGDELLLTVAPGDSTVFTGTPSRVGVTYVTSLEQPANLALSRLGYTPPGMLTNLAVLGQQRNARVLALFTSRDKLAPMVRLLDSGLMSLPAGSEPLATTATAIFPMQAGEFEGFGAVLPYDQGTRSGHVVLALDRDLRYQGALPYSTIGQRCPTLVSQAQFTGDNMLLVLGRAENETPDQQVHRQLLLTIHEESTVTKVTIGQPMPVTKQPCPMSALDPAPVLGGQILVMDQDHLIVTWKDTVAGRLRLARVDRHSGSWPEMEQEFEIGLALPLSAAVAKGPNADDLLVAYPYVDEKRNRYAMLRSVFPDAAGMWAANPAGRLVSVPRGVRGTAIAVAGRNSVLAVTDGDNARIYSSHHPAVGQCAPSQPGQ